MSYVDTLYKTCLQHNGVRRRAAGQQGSAAGAGAHGSDRVSTGGCTGQYDASQPAKVTCHSSQVQDQGSRSREAHSEASITICTDQCSAVGSVGHRHDAG
jgi:hypothetical protein